MFALLCAAAMIARVEQIPKDSFTGVPTMKCKEADKFSCSVGAVMRQRLGLLYLLQKLALPTRTMLREIVYWICKPDMDPRNRNDICPIDVRGEI